ncbi:A-kinase anchor protein 1, mitochondrial [Calypte anna]|uniref:A-kinase anchor protein 1, mitochondrial n=1 Tax=Calypte anna TaxID=9244 RepID=UPI0011C39D72|nr:A-kinase anchor protein 1, mitochondrial [Calypte anna]XP_030318244.1 A-kinase anchor protein 1, mitochondrial [Calypte anna]XP_030318245.1 A-kinase anchor protein 1, mitochondrial [Calypte anna]XP_030318246.1 A-kinase anchor protein 1, mitochondrial [Calypte anna]XP_030318247.1 A-kinase anchor protein 1, mitochondrial [Calypte anna]XP_030318248.1 A-kinase anchor protein 1, mitochondrial [Calypte anna]XP_030318249.1 A-kinase anchor protein 1, mitochondrial [Calypte anna]XP_030318250.1 A-k
MASRFRTVIPYALPGVLALLGGWWVYSCRKKYASCQKKPSVTTEEEQQEEVQERASSPRAEACALWAVPLSSEEGCPRKETSTCLLSAGSLTPSLLCQTHERTDLSQDLLDLSVTTIHPSTLEDDSEKLERVGSPDGSSLAACASLSGISKSTKCPGSVTSPCLELEKEAYSPQAFFSKEVVSSHKDFAVSMVLDSLGSACLEQSRKEEVSELIAKAVPVCQEKETQPKGGELEGEEVRGVSLDKEEVQKMEQAAIQIISKVILAATEEVLSGSARDVSTRVCQTAASRSERPLEMANEAPSDQLLVEEAVGAEENSAARGDAVLLTSLQTEEQDQSVTDSSCSPHSCSPCPVQGDPADCQVKNCVCRGSRQVGQTPVGSQGGSLERSALVVEDSECSTYVSEGGLSVEDPLQNTALSVTSGQHSDSLSTSASQDTSAEQSSEPCEKHPALKLPGDSQVPYSNGVLEQDGPGLQHECSKAPGVDGENSGGSDVNNVDFVDNGCAMRKTVTRHKSKLGGESSKSDFVIWEIEVPKELVGRLIGKQGKFMTFLRQSSGAKIYVATLPYFRDSQVCHIEGSSHQVEKVLSLIGKKFKDLCLTNVYALPPPTPLTLHSLLMTAWLFLPDGVTVEVVVAHQVDAGHMFLQQHTHPTFHVLRSLDQQMFACYSQPEIPTLPTPVEVGIICAAPGLDGAWLRAQVISYFEESGEVELRYVDYGGYERVKVDTLRQIRSDFLSLPFQGAEVLLDNVVPLPDEDHFSSEADAAVSEMTRGAVLVAQVTNYDSATGLPLIHLWNLMGDEVVSVNRTLVERGFAQWLDY